MLIPIGTNVRFSHKPVANYMIIAANIVVFLLTSQYASGKIESATFNNCLLNPAAPQLHQFISYAFLHHNFWHIFGNMLFLYIFGNSVNARLGNVNYVVFYLAGGIFSGIGHCLTASAPVLGASGAVAAVTGAYMVLFPRSYVHVLYFIFLVGIIDLPAFYFIIFKLVIWDNILGPSLYGQGNVAHSAHIAGYSFGILVPLIMLLLKLLPHTTTDLWALINQWRRRYQYQRVVQQGYDPFGMGSQNNNASPTPSILRPRKKLTEEQKHTNEQIMQLRATISEAIRDTNLNEAASLYKQLIALSPEQVLAQQQQLDIANKLMHNGDYTAAAEAYEKFLQYYTNYPFVEQVQLMLGLLYSRYLNDNENGRKYLSKALEKLTDPSQRQMCQDELKRIEAQN